MPSQVCSVSFKDERGIRHAVELQAESLYEAAILAVREFKKAAWIDGIGPSTPLEIQVRAPVTTHTITMIQVQRWLEGGMNSPRDVIKKQRLKELLAAP